MGEKWHRVAQAVGRAAGAAAAVCYVRSARDGWQPYLWCESDAPGLEPAPLDDHRACAVLDSTVLVAGPTEGLRWPPGAEAPLTAGAFVALQRSGTAPLIVWLGAAQPLDRERLAALGDLLECFSGCAGSDYVHFFEWHPAAFLAVGRSGAIDHCNDFVERLGYHPDDLQGQPVTVLIAASEWARLGSAAEDGPRRIRTLVRRRDGEMVAMELTASRGDDGRVLMLGLDLGAERQLRQFRRLEAVDRMVSGVAHELNNPLQTVVGSAEMLAAMKLSDSAVRRAQRVLSGARRCQEVVDGLLKLARRRRETKVRVDLERVVRSAVRRVESELTEQRVNVRFRVQDPIPTIHGHVLDLEQALENVVRNAFQAVADRASAEVEVCLAASQSAIELQISDNGVGMDPDVLDRAFEPFFTTRGVGAGKGLGLSIALGIVEEHGGVIDVQPRNPGTAVTVSLPVPDPTNTSAEEAAL